MKSLRRQELLNVALAEFGVAEIKGHNDNPRIVQYFSDIGFDGGKLKDETAWCSAFANWCVKQVHLSGSGRLNARSWLKVGKATGDPKPGDLVVLWREDRNSWKGHVGFFITKHGNMIYVLGGNQNNQVNIKPYTVSRLLSFRTLV